MIAHILEPFRASLTHKDVATQLKPLVKPVCDLDGLMQRVVRRQDPIRAERGPQRRGVRCC